MCLENIYLTFQTSVKQFFMKCFDKKVLLYFITQFKYIKTFEIREKSIIVIKAPKFGYHYFDKFNT